MEATFEGHTDWVNDVALVDDQVLASCSNDTTVRLWRAASAGQCTYNLVQHTDCVMALATAPQRGLLASAGLSSEVFVWDIPTGTQLSQVQHLTRCKPLRKLHACLWVYGRTAAICV